MARMPTKFKRKEQIARDTMAFIFEKPENYSFIPGQYTNLKFTNLPADDGKGASRELSIASAPHDPELMIATRMRDSVYKKYLKDYPLETELLMKSAEGGLALHSDTDKPAVFIAGGIGVTPFRSIIRDALHRQTNHRLYLFHFNRTREDAPFFDELIDLAVKHPQLSVIHSLTQEAADWPGETTHFSLELLKKYVEDPQSAIYYVVGSPGLVDSVKDILTNSGISDEQILRERFTGY